MAIIIVIIQYLDEKINIYGKPFGDFTINLISNSGDKLFHFNPRFAEQLVSFKIYY